MSLATTDSLIWASSSSLLDPLLLRGPCRDQISAVAGHVPQLADRRWRHEAGPQQLPLGELAQPHRVQGVGLGPPRQMLDVAGIHQPGLEPVGLQQVEDPLPVVAGCFHHHPGHAQLPQPVHHDQQRPGHRLVAPHLLRPPAALAWAGDPHAAGQLGLADIQGGHPLDDLLGLLCLLQHAALPGHDRQRSAARRSRRATANLIRVLTATVKGPSAAPSTRLSHGLQRPQKPGVSGQPARFSPTNGRPAGHVG
jgi:hypothetical protein